MKNTIHVNGHEVSIKVVDKQDYISLTDMARRFNERPIIPIQAWLKRNATLRFIELWELLYNPDFKVTQMSDIKQELAEDANFMSAKQIIGRTNAIGIQSRAGRYGGTYAHVDIAFEFATWLSPEFKLYLITEFKRLKSAEANQLKQGWDFRRFFAKVYYDVHTQSIRDHVIPRLSPQKGKEGIIYASEADVLNLALFGCTAKEWRESNPQLAESGNIRDYASIYELTVLSYLEGRNAELNQNGIDKETRIMILSEIARYQLQILLKDERLRLEER